MAETKRRVTVKDVNAHVFVKEYAAYLKKSGLIKPPKWVDLVKTGVFKELPPSDEDWYFIRAASMARKLYVKKKLGVGVFRKIYGGCKRNGNQPKHHADGSGAIARHILKQLESISVVAKDEKGGRRLTEAGRKDLNKIASSIKV